VRISEIQLAWLGRELPAEARVCAPASRRWHQRILAA
jgi:hypothetical protein